MRIDGRKMVWTLGVAALAVTGAFVVLTLTHMESIRASVAVRRSAQPVLASPAGELVIVPTEPAFYISRRAVVAPESCAAAGLRLATADELRRAAQGATAEKDVSLYGVEGLAANPGPRCAKDQ
jgi:hypothetical protein